MSEAPHGRYDSQLFCLMRSLTNAHSKKIENQMYAFAIHAVHCNFARVHQTMRVTPATEVGIGDHVWSIEEIVSLLERNANIAA